MPQTHTTIETDDHIWGRINTPWDLTRRADGRSGGEVALIAAGGSPLGLGGSLDIPAQTAVSARQDEITIQNGRDLGQSVYERTRSVARQYQVNPGKRRCDGTHKIVPESKSDAKANRESEQDAQVVAESNHVHGPDLIDPIALCLFCPSEVGGISCPRVQTCDAYVVRGPTCWGWRRTHVSVSVNETLSTHRVSAGK